MKVAMALCLSAFVFAAAAGETAEFVRGDVNGVTGVDLGDAVFILQAIFAPGSPLPKCDDAADANDSGGITISDAVYILLYLYCNGLPPPSPFPQPDSDPTVDELNCESPMPSFFVL